MLQVIVASKLNGIRFSLEAWVLLMVVMHAQQRPIRQVLLLFQISRKVASRKQTEKIES